MPCRRPFAGVVSLALAAPLLLLAPPASAAAVAKPYDFNGDGFPELVVGAPELQVGSDTFAGGVVVYPASAAGVSTAGTVLTQDSAGVPGAAGENQNFGAAFASADFDHDGYADLAVGVPGLPDGQGGRVIVLRGSAAGLATSGGYTVARPGAPDHDRFGTSLVSADFDGDGYADLAVGAITADRVEGPEYYPNGSVVVLEGGQKTFSPQRSTVLHGQRSGKKYDLLFGSSLAVGDVDGDARPDLVVGSLGLPYDDGEGHGGSVSVCTTAAAGPGPCRQVAFGYNTGSTALAVGNVKGDARDEIVVGQPENGTEGDEPGVVYTLSLTGTGSALKAKTAELTQGTKGVPGSNERNDEFGFAVALGDLDRDGYADLVVGSPGETISGRNEAGRVTVVHGGKKGYRTSGNQAFDQGTKGVPGAVETEDSFGGAVALLDHDADGRLDLTVGAPGENDGGGITTLKGSGKSFTTKDSKSFGLGGLAYPTPYGAGLGSVLGS
ncbi:FG-GAP repeat protein [Microlunatus antarcticus]